MLSPCMQGRLFTAPPQAPTTPLQHGTPPRSLSKLRKIPTEYGPHADLSLDKAVASTQHKEMGTVALVQAKGQGNAQGPSNEQLWAPLGTQEQLNCPSAPNVTF